MIVVKLMGGLGNQLFQYALGRHLALRHHCALKLDLSFLENEIPDGQTTYRKYGLGIFHAAANTASPAEVARFCKPKGMVSKLLFKAKQLISPALYYREQGFAFQESVFGLSNPLYLEGYWQSERYFKDIAAVLREDLRFRPALSAENQALLTKISASTAVALHVRRGDYVSKPSTNAFHGTCDIAYYERAIAQMQQRVPNPSFFIFSDDPAWAEEHIAPKGSVIVTHNKGEQSYEDLRMMSLCHHQIIANSSFSWWAAWLNSKPEKVVIAPKKWFNTTELVTTDLLPPSWIAL